MTCTRPSVHSGGGSGDEDVLDRSKLKGELWFRRAFLNRLDQGVGFDTRLTLCGVVLALDGAALAGFFSSWGRLDCCPKDVSVFGSDSCIAGV